MAMRIIKTMRRQYAVYWEISGYDGYGGITFDDPIEVKCRWQVKRNLVKNDDGEEIISNAMVFPDRTMVNGSYMYLGRLAEFADSSGGLDGTKPTEIDGAYEIIQREEIPTLKADQILYKVFLT